MADLLRIMARNKHRRSFKAAPREYARTAFIDQAFALDCLDLPCGGGGGGGGSQRKLKLPEMRLGGVFIGGRIVQRMGIVVGSDGRRS